MVNIQSPSGSILQISNSLVKPSGHHQVARSSGVVHASRTFAIEKGTLRDVVKVDELIARIVKQLFWKILDQDFFSMRIIVGTRMFMSFDDPLFYPRSRTILTKCQEICTSTLVKPKSPDEVSFISIRTDRESSVEHRTCNQILLTKIDSLSISDRSLDAGHTEYYDVSDILREVRATFYFFVSFLDLSECKHRIYSDKRNSRTFSMGRSWSRNFSYPILSREAFETVFPHVINI